MLATKSISLTLKSLLFHWTNKYKLLILESLYIQQLKPDLNLDFTSFPVPTRLIQYVTLSVSFSLFSSTLQWHNSICCVLALTILKF